MNAECQMQIFFIKLLEFQGPTGPSVLAPAGSCGALPSTSPLKTMVCLPSDHQGIPFGHQGLPLGHQGLPFGHQGLPFGHQGLPLFNLDLFGFITIKCYNSFKGFYF